MDETLIASLQQVGFSLYEARLYVALLHRGSLNGNEVATQAAVPSSKVYRTLDKLQAEGIVHSLKRGSSTLFAATAPAEVIARLRKQYNAPLDYLADELPKVQTTTEPQEPFLTVTGGTALAAGALAIIEAATEEIHISCWEEELEALQEPLTAAHKRGVGINGMLYGPGNPPPGNWLQHHYEDIVGDRVGGRLLVLVADDLEALVGRIARVGETVGVRSRNRVLTMIVEEYLHHDNILQRAQIKIGFDEWDKWWQADPDARAEILGHAFSQLAAAGPASE